MKILVTGASGFLGSNLVEKLLSLGHNVITISRKAINYHHHSLTHIICDLIDINTITIEGRIDAVYHTAATVNFNTDTDAIYRLTNDNILVANAIADFVLKNKINKLIISSSCSVYQPNYIRKVKIDENHKLCPVNLYAISKLASEWILQTRLKDSATIINILRYSSIYGQGQRGGSIIPIFIQNAISGQPITIFGSGQRIQDYVYIDDVIIANLKCIEHRLPFGTILNIGSGETISDLSLAETIKSVWKSDSEIQILNQQSGDEVFFTYSLERAINLINYYPRSLEMGLKQYYNNLRKETL